MAKPGGEGREQNCPECGWWRDTSLTWGWWRVKRGVRPGAGELPAGRDLTARRLPVAGNTITGDALYCQRDYCQQLWDAGGDDLVMVQKNQGQRYADSARAFAEPAGADH